MKKVLRVIGIVLLVLVLLLAAGLGVLTLMEYRPADVEDVALSGSADRTAAPGDSLTLVSWNIGYGALGDNADFFMDGGHSVQTADEAQVQANLKGITDKLAEMKPDIIFLQEIDANSDRSHHVDERQVISDALLQATGVNRITAFANNFKAFVPYPLPPIGSVDSGLYTLSALPVSTAARVSLPVPFSWPIRTVNLKRCLLVTRVPLENDSRELVLVNLHLEAYDSGEGKIAQARQLGSLLKAEEEKGNYVIAGGDFNQVFSNVDTSAYPTHTGMWQPGFIDAKDFEGLSLLMDNRVPTCRSLDKPLAGASLEGFQFYMIDGFMISPNVRVDALETVDTGFVSSDHNPVRMQITLEK